MRNKLLLALVVGILAFTLPVFAQVTAKTGSIYGKVVDDKGAPLPGVSITLESDVIPSQTAGSGPSGGFRFANLPPGTYAVNFSIEGFTEVRQESVTVSVGSQVQLEITLKPSLSEEFTVIGETPVVDTKKTGTSQNFSRDYLDEVPSARDPWTIIDQTSGVTSDRVNVAGSESGQQAGFFARGAASQNAVWSYDGVNASDPGALGASPTYFDFDAFEELSISTGGMDASVGTNGVQVNIVTKRGGNKWEGNGSYFFVNDSLQGTNTPDQVLADYGASVKGKTNKIDDIKDYGFDIGGPIIKDKLFAWGAFHKNDIGLINIAGNPDLTHLTDYNFKMNYNWNSANETQGGYFKGEKTKSGRGFAPAIQAPETLWEQAGSAIQTPFWANTIDTLQHTWIPNDHTIVTGRYGYVGGGFSLTPAGGLTVPIIYLAAVPQYESTYQFYGTERPTKDFVVDANYYKENLMGGDHEFKFGFEYKSSSVGSTSIYGNGQYIYDSGQTTAGGALTHGYLKALLNLDGTVKAPRTSFYVTDTYRKDKLTLNLGLRFDSQTGTNEPTTIGSVPGFEDVISPIEYAGSDPGITFNDLSPRIGATYDITGDGKTVIRGSYARYYDPYYGAIASWTNPTFTYSGALFAYVNSNNDRVITRDEITSFLGYFGAAGNPFNLEHFLSEHQYGDLKNSDSDEFTVGFERQVAQDLSVAVNYTYRSFNNWWDTVPIGVTSDSYVSAGNYTRSTVLGNFSVPLYTLGFEQDGSGIMRNFSDYNQQYSGVDIDVRKRMSNNFMMSGSLTIQRQKANYNGSDANGVTLADGGLSGNPFAFDPGLIPFEDGQPYAYSAEGSGKSGSYPYSEWQFKFGGVYQFPWDISVGGFARYQQGYPYVLWAGFTDTTLSSFYGSSTRRILVEPFGSRRYDNIFTLDLQFEKAFDMKEYGRLSLMANWFNVTNANTALRRQASLTSSQLNFINEYISPTAFRLGVRYSF